FPVTSRQTCSRPRPTQDCRRVPRLLTPSRPPTPPGSRSTRCSGPATSCSKASSTWLALKKPLQTIRKTPPLASERLECQGSGTFSDGSLVVERNSFRLLPAGRTSGSIATRCRNGKNGMNSVLPRKSWPAFGVYPKTPSPASERLEKPGIGNVLG